MNTGTVLPVAAAAADKHLDAVLAALAGPEAVARDDQREAVRALVTDRRRVLVVQATGWGKSAVYWAATSALRASGAGLTLVVSPLLALMRDQVSAAERAGLVAATINSTNFDEWDDVLAQVDAGALDVLLVSPERLGNPRFEARLPRLLAATGMVVIDEAHCISDWGFDFRPDYQRLTRHLLSLAPGTPVLATTATANARVTADVADQLGSETATFRGSLARTSLRLAVVPGLTALDRWAWVADALGRLDGSGIVYTLTVAEADRVANFLTSAGFEVAAYSGRLDAPARIDIEDRLRRNELKAVVATSALGMGYDKPDLAFCIHVGSPASPVAYYQQVGRAGRALDTALAVLLPAENDERIWEYFASASVPDPDLVQRALAALADGPASLPTLESSTGIRRNRLEGMLKLLAASGIVTKDAQGWATTGEPYVHDTAKWEALAATRRAEADLMRRYEVGHGLLNRVLQRMATDFVIERNPGHGWRFAPVLKSDDAETDSYRFRMIIEPAGLLEPGYTLDRARAQLLRRDHEAIIATPRNKLSRIRLFHFFAMNAEFHELIAAGSGNGFLLQAVQQQNRLRRLLIYRWPYPLERMVESCIEHMDLLTAIEKGDMKRASTLMYRHLDVASQTLSEPDKMRAKSPRVARKKR